MSEATLRIPLPDLDCPACADRIASRLRRLEFVREAWASATEGQARVRVAEPHDLVRIVETIRQAGTEPSTIEISIPISGHTTSLEQTFAIERELRATEGVLRAGVDLAAGELVAVLATGRADADRLRRLLMAREWNAAHPGPGAASPPDKSQVDSARRSAFRAALIILAALAATLLCARVGPRAIAPLFTMAGDLRERASAWLALPEGAAHGLLALVAIAGILAGGAPLFRGAVRDFLNGAATSRLLASVGVILLVVASLGSSLGGALFGVSPPLFYASAIWSLAVVATGATLGEWVLVRRRRRPALEAQDEEGARERLERLRSRGVFAEGRSGRRGRVEAAWWGAITIAAAAVTGAIWLAADRSRWPEAILAASSVLLVAAPGAFALVAPLAAERAIRQLRRRGIAIAGSRVLETAARIEFLFATLRGGVAHPRLRVANFVLLEGIPLAELLAIAAAGGSPADPRIRAIADRLERDGETAGAGDLGGIDVGSSELLRQRGVELGPVEAEIAEFERSLKTVVVVARHGRPLGAIALESELREGGAETVERLRALGCETWIATEDTEETATASAAAIGATRHTSGLDRAGKARLVSRTRDEGKRAAFLGSANDTLAARLADLTLSFRDAGPDATFEDALLIRNDTLAVAELMETARETKRRARTSHRILVAYHLLAIPLAAGALAPLTGYAPAPFVAALGSLIVTAIIQNRGKE